jgi:hypothetical protein
MLQMQAPKFLNTFSLLSVRHVLPSASSAVIRGRQKWARVCHDQGGSGKYNFVNLDLNWWSGWVAR